ncbi:J domain-containing protein [SAR202 cluster bacterium AD-802-F09_MRT_200m]|nr:J domain-containing protein [SAR202 cluster bacterium AD-802-F09_MRT_200m]
MREETYYELLQVSPSADLEIITGAYRALIRRHHPDRNPSPSAEATTKRLNEAWEVLSDPAKRAEYDRQFAAGSSSRPVPPPRPPNRPTQETPPPNRPPPPPPRASQPPGHLKDSLDTGRRNLIIVGVIASILFIIIWAANA